MFPRVREERSLWAQGVPCLGRVPLDPVVAADGDGGTPLLLTHPGSEAAQAFRDLAGAVGGAIGL